VQYGFLFAPSISSKSRANTVMLDLRRIFLVAEPLRSHLIRKLQQNNLGGLKLALAMNTGH